MSGCVPTSSTLWAIISTVIARIVKALRISHQCLARQRSVKRSLFQKPLVRMSKEEGTEKSFKIWWGIIEMNHEVDVRYPHDKHELQGHKSNSAKVNERESFLVFVDAKLTAKWPTTRFPKSYSLFLA